MLPETLTVGTTLNFDTIVTGFPANDGWTLTYRLVPRASGSAISFSGIPDASDPASHRIQVSANTASTWTPGMYSYAAWVSRSGEVHDIKVDGVVKLLPDPRTSNAPLDLRSDARKALDDAKTALAGYTPTIKSYTIGGRSMTFNSKADLLGVIEFWKAEVFREERAERLAKGLADPRKVFLRVGRG